ncbi:Protein of unknown function [Dyella sp. OK004]|uniref:DUF4019 domain-containing protein n=1 Tax=Dyella sp. OK004 TaxID=1855292 RepID=UPI0008E6B238|nr:DUF4019 domain-containing protein [Dyella sp. OK004]SFS19714.1 Protein of unknown function [Dyella sp. OK004]
MEINKTRSRTIQTAVKRLAPACAFAALLSVGQAHAQQSTSLDSAVTTATNWAAQADRDQADAMWQASNPAMQKSVSKADWSKYVDGLKKQFGATQSRTWLQIGRVENPNGLPPGEYLNVAFAAKHATAPTLETVSLAKTPSGWSPVGYVVRAIPATPPPAAPAGAPAGAKPAK